MKILMTTDSIGGVWPYGVDLSRELGALGVEIELACMGGALNDAQRIEARRLTNAVVHESPYRLEWMEDPWADVERAEEWLDALLHARRCDLLHFNCYGPAARGWSVPVLLVAHSCVHSWWRAVHGVEPGPEWSRYRGCVVRALANAQRVVAPSATMLGALRDCYPEAQLGRRSCVIQNGIDAARWRAGEDHGLPLVLGAGRVWDEAKNLRALIGVAADLGCPVVIAGDHGRFERLSNGAILLGRLSRARLADYYRCAAVFAHPARYEPFGLAVLEAAASGCALVLGDIPSLRELWERAALFVDPDDEAALRATLQRLLADPDERRRLAEAARARALRYGARRMALAYVEQYRALLGEPLATEGVA